MSQIATTIVQVAAAHDDVPAKIANVSPNVQCWRLVHNGTKVLALFESSGQTTTINTLFCATTREEIDAEIARLNLTPLPAPATA